MSGPPTLYLDGKRAGIIERVESKKVSGFKHPFGKEWARQRYGREIADRNDTLEFDLSLSDYDPDVLGRSFSGCGVECRIEPNAHGGVSMSRIWPTLYVDDWDSAGRKRYVFVCK